MCEVLEVPCKPEDMECRFLDHRQAHLHYSSGCEDCSSFTSLGWLPGILVLNTSHLYPHHPQTYAPLPAPLPRGPLPYPGLYAGKMPPTTPMMSPTQHTFAFTHGLHTVRQYLTTTPPPAVPIAARICFHGLVHYQVWYL